MDYYWPRIEDVAVPGPVTEFVPLDVADGAYDWDTDRILSFMTDHGFPRAFVRTQFKAATVRLREGSFIHAPDPTVIDRTVESLLAQNDQQHWPHGDTLVVREWLDLDFCPYPSHSCHPSVRFFVDGGDVIGQTPHDVDRQFVCPGGYDYLQSRLAGVSFAPPQRYADRVARAFPEATWGVDFVMDTTGTWYCTELNFNGVYWNRRENRWWNMCGQGLFAPFSPVEIHSAALWGVRPESSTDRSRYW